MGASSASVCTQQWSLLVDDNAHSNAVCQCCETTTLEEETLACGDGLLHSTSEDNLQAAVPQKNLVSKALVQVSALPADGDSNGTASVKFEFACQDEKREVIFSRRPFGFAFSDQLPLVVTKITPGGVAEQQGVERGWEILKVGGIPVENLSGQDIIGLIQERPEKLKWQKLSMLDVEFEFQGERMVVHFTKAPLGITFNEARTKDVLAVCRVMTGGEGAKLGIQPGWVVKRVGSQVVTAKAERKIVLLLRDLSALLPRD